MNEDFEIPDDPKFEKTVRIQANDMLRAWNIGDFKAAGRALDALKNFLWAWLKDEARERFENVKFKSKVISDFYTEEDKETLEKRRTS